MGYAKEKEKKYPCPEAWEKEKKEKEKERQPISQNKRQSHAEKGASFIQKDSTHMHILI